MNEPFQADDLVWVLDADGKRRNQQPARVQGSYGPQLRLVDKFGTVVIDRLQLADADTPPPSFTDAWPQNATGGPWEHLQASPSVTTLAPDKHTIGLHLYSLFEPLACNQYPDSWIEIAVAHPERGNEVDWARIFSPFDMKPAIEFAMKMNADGYNVYVGPALRQDLKDENGEPRPRPRSGRASDEHVVTAFQAWAEFDHDAERIDRVLQEKGWKPGKIVWTGTVPQRRRQVYINLSETVGVDDLEAVNKALHGLFSEEDNVAAPAHVMRLAGTINYPTPQKRARGYIVELVTLDLRLDAPRYTVEQLTGQAASEGTSVRPQRRRPHAPLDIDEGDDHAIAVEQAINYLTYGAPEAIEGRQGDNTTYYVACRVKDLGLTATMCLQLMWEHWNSSKAKPPWTVEDLAQKVINAYRYGKKPIGVYAPPDLERLAPMLKQLQASIEAAIPVVEAPPPPAAPPGATDVDWPQPEGLLGDMADWTMTTSRRPNRPLAVAAALAVLSAVCGRWLYGPTGTALGLYLVALAATGVGKDRPLAAVLALLKAAGLEQLHTSAKAFSVSAIEQMVVDRPGCVATVDEIGVSLFGRMSHKNANIHETAMRAALMELWSRDQFKGPFSTTRRAHIRGEPKGPASISIAWPNLTLFGVSTPEACYASIPTAAIKDGFLNRFLFVEAGPRGDPQDVPEVAFMVPEEIARALRDLPPTLAGHVAATWGVFDRRSNIGPAIRRLAWDSDAVRERANAFEVEIEERMDADREQAPLLGRVFEYTVRLASLHAVSRAGSGTTVTDADLSFGMAFAQASAKTMAAGVANLMADSDYEVKFNRVRNLIRDAGQIGRRELLRAIRSVDARERDGIIKHLLGGDWIEPVKILTAGRMAEGWRWKG